MQPSSIPQKDMQNSFMQARNLDGVFDIDDAEMWIRDKAIVVSSDLRPNVWQVGTQPLIFLEWIKLNTGEDEFAWIDGPHIAAWSGDDTVGKNQTRRGRL